jgi:hypothetical protein
MQGVIVNKHTVLAAVLAAGLLGQTKGFTQVLASNRLNTAVDSAKLLKPPPQINPLLPTGTFPGQVALQVQSGDYLTALYGGGQSINALLTSFATIGPNERFTVEQTAGGYLSFITAGGYFVSVTDGVSDLTRVTQTVLTAPADSTLFSVSDAYDGSYTLETYYSYDLYFVDGGGQYTGAIGTYPASSPPAGLADFNRVSAQQCGDLGSGYRYNIATRFPGGVFNDNLGAVGGRTQDAIFPVQAGEASQVLTLIRQVDGSYALETSNGINYVTAVDGGGLAHGTAESDNLVTNRTEVNAWEKFWITDQGNCTYTIQTTSGYYVAYTWLYSSNTMNFHLSLSTDISDPAAAPSIGYDAYFALRPLWN